MGGPMLKDANAYGDDFKEPLGLDENGLIKVSHDAKDIQEMVNRGMIKIKEGKVRKGSGKSNDRDSQVGGLNAQSAAASNVKF